jgi:holo-[acyl-carrier protein] synthase
MIHSVGIDLVRISRIEKAIKRWNGRFKKKIYSEGEIDYCDCRAFSPQHYAARFAAKEAFIKCLGSKMKGGPKFREIEVVNGPGGKPELNVCGSTEDLLSIEGMKGMHLSISHADKYAVAVVVLEI